MYHRVVGENSDIFKSSYGKAQVITPLNKFMRQMRKLADGYKILSLRGAIQATKMKQKLPANSFVVTFDDGFKDNYTKAFPILKKLGIHATFFVMGEPSFLGKMRWLDKLYYIIDHAKKKNVTFEFKRIRFDLDFTSKDSINKIKDFLKKSSHRKREGFLSRLLKILRIKIPQRDTKALYMDKNDILDLVNSGMDIGVHTMTHPDLKQIPFSEAKSEILRCMKLIKRISKSEEVSFAYPFGWHGTYNKKIINFLRRNGFLCACTTIPGENSESTSLFELRRMTENNIVLN